MKHILVNGVRIAYERRGRGNPMMLVHGFPLDHTIWEEVAALLEPHCDLILPDLRGFGRSDAPERGGRMAQFAGDLLAILNQLKIEKVALVGHSMGGYATLAFACMFPERLRGLGLVATQHLSDTPERKAGRLATAEAVLRDGIGALAKDMSARLTANPEQIPVLLETILRQRPIGVAQALLAMAERPDLTELIGKFKFPTVVIAGLADALIPPERSREMMALIPRAYLLELEGIGHMPMMEAPSLVAQGLMRLA